MKLYTVGYEGCDIQEFTSFLRKNKIHQVADLRKNPVSRKKGFSKNKLAEALDRVKIEYIPMTGLGVPTEWRKQAKAKEITRKKMFSDYVKKVLPKAETEFAELLSRAKKQDLALLCYEADAFDCHRFFVAQKMKKLSKTRLDVIHLQPRPKLIESDSKRPKSERSLFHL